MFFFFFFQSLLVVKSPSKHVAPALSDTERRGGQPVGEALAEEDKEIITRNFGRIRFHLLSGHCRLVLFQFTLQSIDVK